MTDDTTTVKLSRTLLMTIMGSISLLGLTIAAMVTDNQELALKCAGYLGILLTVGTGGHSVRHFGRGTSDGVDP